MLIVEADQYKVLKTRTTEAHERLLRWSKKIKLEFNPQKTQALFFGKKPGQQRPTYKMGEHTIRCSDELTYLGVVISANRKWDAHIS